MPQILTVTLTHEQKQRLADAVRARVAAWDRYMDTSDPADGAAAFDAETRLTTLMHALGVDDLGGVFTREEYDALTA